jgi:hypothetical protein
MLVGPGEPATPDEPVIYENPRYEVDVSWGPAVRPAAQLSADVIWRPAQAILDVPRDVITLGGDDAEDDQTRKLTSALHGALLQTSIVRETVEIETRLFDPPANSGNRFPEGTLLTTATGNFAYGDEYLLLMDAYVTQNRMREVAVHSPVIVESGGLRRYGEAVLGGISRHVASNFNMSLVIPRDPDATLDLRNHPR